MVQPRPAVVSIMADGSVMVTTAGMEMGQGIFTKVKQVQHQQGLACYIQATQHFDLTTCNSPRQETHIVPHLDWCSFTSLAEDLRPSSICVLRIQG
jgi:hypothetical protein